MVISKKIWKAKIFSVQIDTTQDISVKDQCSILVRYTDSVEIQERMVGFVNIKGSTTGEHFHEVVSFTTVHPPLHPCWRPKKKKL